MLIITTDHNNGFHLRAVLEAMFKIRMRGVKRLYGQTDLGTKYCSGFQQGMATGQSTDCKDDFASGLV